MGTWSVNDESIAKIDSNGKITFSENTSSEDREITVTYDDQSGNTASTVITQMGRFSMDNGMVDLGLPSGNIWAKNNIGGSGAYYQYGKTKIFQETSGETAYDGNENPLAGSADTACINYTSIWHMPTKEDFEELIANTEQIWGVSGVNGMTFRNTKGEITFLADGAMTSEGKQWETVGLFWTSSLNSSNEPICIELYNSNEGCKIIIRDGRDEQHAVRSRSLGFNVRAVLKDYSRMKY